MSPGLWGSPEAQRQCWAAPVFIQGAPGSSRVWRLKYQDEGRRLACLYSHFKIILVTAWKDFPGWSVHSWENSCGFEDIFPGTERASPAVQSTDCLAASGFACLAPGMANGKQALWVPCRELLATQ